MVLSEIPLLQCSVLAEGTIFLSEEGLQSLRCGHPSSCEKLPPRARNGASAAVWCHRGSGAPIRRSRAWGPGAGDRGAGAGGHGRPSGH